MGRKAFAGAIALFLAAGLSAFGITANVGLAADGAVAANVHASLETTVRQAAPGDSVTLMFRQDIRDGWHTYWRNPGDSGQEIAVEWSLPEGAAAGPLQWPAPRRIEYGELVNYGYEGSIALLADVTVPADWPEGRSFPVRAEATWLACETICVPESGSFTLDIPTGRQTVADDSRAAALAAARAHIPVPSPWPASFAADGDRMSLQITAPDLAPGRVQDVYFFADQWGKVAHSAEQRADYRDGVLSVALRRGDLPAGDNLTGVLTMREEGGSAQPLAFAVTAARAAGGMSVPAAGARGSDGGGPGGASPGRLSTASVGAASAAGGLSLPLVLLLAFAGGVLLNLMPCVFPVLAIKALGLVKGAGGTRGARLAGGLSYMSGVLVSFALLGAAFLALRAGGDTIGWGFQLQDPLVVALLAYVLFLVGLNLAGLFEIGGSWTGLGQAATQRQGHVGSFFTGVLAAVVAAPCTAPFMTTALGFAFTQPAPVAMAAVLALGAGLAAPYVLLTALPGLARRLPKPGAWMVTFKQFLAFPMFASAAWLVWVLAQQAGPDAVFAALLGMTALGLAAWAFGRASGRRRLIGRSVAAVSAGLALWLALSMPDATLFDTQERAVADLASAPAGEVFSQARLDALRQEARPVLVNMTAAWCITCKVNERVALKSGEFLRALEASGTVYLVGDWTRRDPEITVLLRDYGRAGVPLYVLFYPDAREPLVLPQILTPAIVVDALETVRTPTMAGQTT